MYVMPLFKEYKVMENGVKNLFSNSMLLEVEFFENLI